MTPDFTTATLATPSRAKRAVPAVALTQVSVVVPVFNERECVDRLIAALVSLEAEYGDRFEFEFVLVDDGSHDGTPDMLRELIAGRPNYRVVEHGKNRGIAAAIRTGIVHAQHEIVASMDADCSYDVVLLEKMIPLLAGNVDVVSASPYHPEGGVDDVAWWRLWLSQRASWLYRQVMRSKLHCYTGCFRVYRRSRVVDLVPRNSGYVGVAELLWLVDRQGGEIVECPAVLHKRIAGNSKMKIFREALRHLRLVSQIARERLTGRPYN
jgi:dolichol-phosphate mannosyltransferase